MFRLSGDDLERRILGCADGPASFNSKMFQRGRKVVSCDPLYQLSSAQIRTRIDAAYEDVISQTRLNQHKFVWDRIHSVDDLGRIRLAAMSEFLSDYETGRSQGRYLAAELPNLPFGSAIFDLALCSHFLFLYSDHFSLEFHQQSVAELCRVANEVRMFPLLDYNGEPSPFLNSVVEQAARSGHAVAIERVPYEFQRGGNEMLRIVKRSQA
jgi:hypothetical protein